MELHILEFKVEWDSKVSYEATHFSPHLSLLNCVFVNVFKEASSFIVRDSISLPLCVEVHSSELAQAKVDFRDLLLFHDIHFFDYKVHDEIFKLVHIDKSFALWIIFAPVLNKRI